MKKKIKIDDSLLLKSIQNSHNQKDIELLLTNNMRLIYSFARKYEFLAFNDIVQEGVIGLLTAIDKYEVDRGTKFSTYASFWISQAINRGYRKLKRTVRLPATAEENLSKVKKCIKEYQIKHHEEPSDDIISNTLGIKAHKVGMYRQLDNEVISLDATVNGYEESLIETIEDKTAIAYETDIEQNELIENLKKALTILSKKEYHILELHFGLNDEPNMSLADIGRIYNISRERVRQIKESALKKIKASEYGKILENYLI